MKNFSPLRVSDQTKIRSLLVILGLMGCCIVLSACGRRLAITTAQGDEPSAAVENEQSDSGSAEITSESNAEGNGTESVEPETATVGSVMSSLDPEAVFDPEAIEIVLEPLVDGLTRPVLATHANDGSNRLFIIEQPGVIRIFADGALLATPFLDIQERVGDSGNEQGLLGLAFAPNFSESGHAYVNYTDLNGDTVVSRFDLKQDDPNQADPTTEFVVLAIAQPARNHNGGMLTFGPDGYLYIGTGDGGAANDRFENGQNPSSLLGKMLRIDVTSNPSQPYLIPADNPWIHNDWTVDGQAVDVLDEIWAVGLRNPWRYSFDRLTNDLWIADVGQNKLEEVNFVLAATLASGSGNGSNNGAITSLNFGWPIMEANECFTLLGGCDSTGLVLPVSEYDHSGHCSITGGYVYRGQEFPALQGAYLYGDYCSGVIWATVPDGSGGWTSTEMLSSGLNISSFGEDEEGELYMTALSGTVYKVAVGN